MLMMLPTGEKPLLGLAHHHHALPLIVAFKFTWGTNSAVATPFRKDWANFLIAVFDIMRVAKINRHVIVELVAILTRSCSVENSINRDAGAHPRCVDERINKRGPSLRYMKPCDWHAGIQQRCRGLRLRQRRIVWFCVLRHDLSNTHLGLNQADTGSIFAIAGHTFGEGDCACEEECVFHGRAHCNIQMIRLVSITWFPWKT
mmetsp:Transcript_109088/g.243634  ORF Transcript_109088/g.243634 Transcript_109088/m.243634 type:complete len:202 (-) Transcript_109088:7-612(-)